MAQDFVTPEGRIVMGGPTLVKQTDMNTGKPELDDDGQPVMGMFIALAIPKTDPGFPALWATIVAQARAEFPHLFDANGNCTHPKFAFKYQDGDGVDTNGKSVAEKPGHAGHHIIKFASRYAPKCFYEGKFDAIQQIQNPDQVIKKGYYARIFGTVAGNGVKPDNRQAVPGLYLSPLIISLTRIGEEITTGPDATKAFANAPAMAAFSGSVVATQAAGTSAIPSPGALPALPGQAAAPAAMPALPGQAAAPAAMPALPGQAAMPAMPGQAAMPAMPAAPPAGPVFTMTATAQGFTREQMLANGWTDDALIAAGHMTRTG